MNVVTIIGRLTDHPELKHTSNDIAVCSFCLAVTRPKAKDKTDFINCVVWNQSAEYLTTYGRKGNLVAVTGVLTSRKYDDKDGNHRTAFEVVCDLVSLCESKDKGQDSNGNNRNATEVIVNEVNFVDSKSDNPSVSTPSYMPNAYNAPQFEEMDNNDDLPFEAGL